MSSNSMPFIAWSTMHSAARTLVEKGAFWSNMIFKRVVAAADEPCWSRAIVCETASRRAAPFGKCGKLSKAIRSAPQPRPGAIGIEIAPTPAGRGRERGGAGTLQKARQLLLHDDSRSAGFHFTGVPLEDIDISALSAQ